MVIWLASYPRSGNTFFRILLHYLYDLETYSVYPLQDAGQQSLEDVDKLRLLVGQPEIPFDLQAAAVDSAPWYIKTHDLPGEDEAPAILIVRDGRDALVSYAHFLLKTTEGMDACNDTHLFETTLEQIITGDQPNAFGGWSRHVSAWLNRAGQSAIVRYEDLIVDPIDTVQVALEQSDVEPRPVRGPAPSFEALHEKVPWFFRRGRIGTWQDELSPRLQELFLDLHGDVLTRLGYHAYPAKIASEPSGVTARAMCQLPDIRRCSSLFQPCG
jgi:hypothetical protein